MITKADLSKIITDDKISIAKGGIVPIGHHRDNLLFRQLEAIAKKYEFSLRDPIKDIPEEALNTIIYGSDELFRVGGPGALSQMMSFNGVISMVEQNGSEE